MQIVVLDGYTLNPGDLSWAALEKLGDVTIYDRTAPEQVVMRAKDAAIVLTNKTVLTAEILAQLPKLQYIGVLATGYNVVDIAAAKQRQIIVTNIPDYSTYSVAQLTFALLFELTNRVHDHASAVRSGEWANSIDFSFTKGTITELYGKTFGIIGHGQIGQQVGRIAQALGMQVITVRRASSPAESLYGESYVTEEELLAQSDMISLHCPLTVHTQQMINEQTISLMKQSAILINTARGGLVDEAALAMALNKGRLAGAALDVLSTEPPAGNNPLLTADNCIITPHIAWASKEARERLMQICIDNIVAFQAGEARNIVGN
ncbi:D-2-hydroxyacid dehydrogenase [Paenibacillus yanchengensis]|uniref:D-2-hydroxyacid dehydrogenase n=1 Tax=Paenibacillus yanchengensis TaxID=2035833 RepID=A0ABW4YIH9_9BACL